MRLRHSLEKAAILDGLYSMMGMTGEPSSPSTSKPSICSWWRNQVALECRRAIFFRPEGKRRDGGVEEMEGADDRVTIWDDEHSKAVV